MNEREIGAIADKTADDMTGIGALFTDMAAVLRQIGPLLAASAADRQRLCVALAPFARLATAAEERGAWKAYATSMHHEGASVLLDESNVAVPLGLLREARRALGETALDTGAQSG